MNSVHKFKSFNEKENKFYYFENGRYYKDITCNNCVSERICSEFSWWNAQQYIGLKDKNNVEIYRGDIVKCIALSTEEIVVINDIINIPVQITAWPTAYGENKGSIEVIGNRYTNPDLLKEVNND